MKTMIIYNSRTGFTKKYAEWLSEEIGCEVVSLDKVATVDVSEYNTVIFASYFYAGTISKIKWLKKQTIQNKIVLLLGASPITSPEVQTHIDNNFKGDRDGYKVFYAQSGLCYEKMNFIDKMMMTVPQIAAKKKFGENSEEYIDISHSFDKSSRNSLTHIITYINELHKNGMNSTNLNQ